MHETRAQHKSSDFASTAAEHLNMHETRATATFALSMPHTIWKGLLFLVFYSMCCLRCAPDSSHSDISHGPPLLGLGDAAVARVWGTSAHRHTRNSSHSDISMRPPTLPWPATCLLHLHFCALFAPLPRRNGRSPLDPPRHTCPHGV